MSLIPIHTEKSAFLLVHGAVAGLFPTVEKNWSACSMNEGMVGDEGGGRVDGRAAERIVVREDERVVEHDGVDVDPIGAARVGLALEIDRGEIA